MATGRDVRRERDARHWTRADLAEKVDCTPSWIKQLEDRGDEPLPVKSRFTARIEHVLGLAEDVEEPTPEALPSHVIAAALEQASDTLFVAEMARRLARAHTGSGHDQSNVAPFGLRGFDTTDGEQSEHTGPA